VSGGQEVMKLSVVRLKWEELSDLDEVQKAVLGLVCHAANEVNALMRIYTFHELPATEWEYDALEIREAYWCQKSVVLRTWSAKLFEIQKVFSENKRTRVLYSRDDTNYNMIVDELTRALEPLTNCNEYKIARSSRNEVTFHYALKSARITSSQLCPDDDVSFFLHQSDGGSYFRLGEKMMLSGLLQRNFENSPFGVSGEEAFRRFEGWMGWNLRATGWLRSVVNELVQHCVVNRQVGKVLDEIQCIVNSKLIARTGEVVVPLYLRDAAT
jgi:hypothetical protein